MEVIGMSWRSTIGIAFCFPFSIGYIMLAGMAWALRDWWKLQICISIPTVIFFGFYWILPESPRWLLSKGRVLQAEEILRKAKKENRMLDTKDVSIPGSPGGAATELLSVEQPTSKCILDPCHVLSNESVNETSVGGFTVTSNGNIVMDEKPPATGATMNGTNAPASADSDENGTPGEAGSGGEPRKHTALDLFRVSHMRKVMFNVFLCWFVNAFVYYGLSLNSANLGGNVFLNFALSGAIEIPAYALSIIVMLKFAGRRLLISVAMVSGGAACALIAFIPRGQFANDWPVTALSTVGKFGISASFALIYLFTAELIPTVVRNVGVGLSSTFARIGSILAPFLLLLGDKKTGDFTYPMVICGILSIVSGCLVWLLPETARQPMPDTFEQAKRQSQSSKKRASSSS
ncbi:unnamed protein product [Notodromas monacha]|uniref:Organic cation transporter protein n=1 Tax=Notodromas monacha TaxID=399045 RepID=A0A7R9BZ38_9CRUS|nr:unnamed protein product [Notodromas monacha]CAG0924335.1 unnamed protein product [Notodromas monacha]